MRCAAIAEPMKAASESAAASHANTAPRARSLRRMRRFGRLRDACRRAFRGHAPPMQRQTHEQMQAPHRWRTPRASRPYPAGIATAARTPCSRSRRTTSAPSRRADTMGRPSGAAWRTPGRTGRRPSPRRPAASRRRASPGLARWPTRRRREPPSSEPAASTRRPPWASICRPTMGDTRPDTNNPAVKLPNSHSSPVPVAVASPCRAPRSCRTAFPTTRFARHRARTRGATGTGRAARGAR